MNAGRRAIYGDPANDRHVDLFYERFEMCHRIPIMDRVQLEIRTIPLAELLLTKLQIVEINEKDQRDVCALLHEHPVGESDVETINAGEIARLCAGRLGSVADVRAQPGEAARGGRPLPSPPMPSKR